MNYILPTSITIPDPGRYQASYSVRLEGVEDGSSGSFSLALGTGPGVPPLLPNTAAYMDRQGSITLMFTVALANQELSLVALDPVTLVSLTYPDGTTTLSASLYVQRLS